MQLPDQMPEGCNFLGLLQTTLPAEAIAQRLSAAGWTVTPSTTPIGLTSAAGELTLIPGIPMTVRGQLHRPDDEVGPLLGLLHAKEIEGVFQWLNAAGQLQRDLPFDPAMLDPTDPRLPADIKASLRAHLEARKRKPWWKFC